jgi:prepilin-type N-terminal cleavage/methylation domain-containing protein
MKRARAGYTLIEVMTAVFLMTIGATGILAMQGASVRSNQDAHETTVAINFATTWVERLKRDARRWTGVGATKINKTRYLTMVTSNPGTWFLPISSADESAGADYFGFDTLTVGDVRYCVNVSLTVVHAFNPENPGTADPTTDMNAVRADVRVWWHRAASDINRAEPKCTPPSASNTVSDALPNEPRIRRQYLSTVLTWRATGWQ